MYLLVFFDLPMQTAQERKAYGLFRKRLQYGGFMPLQKSIYMRDCPSHESADQHTHKVKKIAPAEGHVCILRVTAAQMSKMISIRGGERKKSLRPSRQLELF